MLTRARAGACVTALALAAIAWGTLTPAAGGNPNPPAWCLRCGDVSGIDFGLNVLLFIPVGIGLRLSGASFPRVLLVSTAVTLAVEIIQWQAAIGRVASFSDLTANVLGAAVGMALAERGGELVLARSAAARTLARGTLVGWFMIQLLTAWEFVPSLTQSAYWAQIAADLGHFERFSGHVLMATIADVPITNGRMKNNELVGRLFKGDARVAASVIPGAPTRAVAPIVSVFDGEQREIMLLGQEGEDLVFRLRTHATDARFRTPTISLFGVFPPIGHGAVEGGRDTLLVSGWRKGWRLTVSASSRKASRSRSAMLLPSYGWALVLPFEHTWTAMSGRFTAAWMALLLFPAGYWGARGLSSAPGVPEAGEAPVAGLRVMTLVGFALLVLVAGLVGLPLILGLTPAGWWQWGGALAGIASGLAVGFLSWLAGRSRSHRIPA